MFNYALEITAHTGSGLTTLYMSLGELVTGPADSPPNCTFNDRIIQPGNYSIQAFQDGKTYGRSQIGYGEIVLDNYDGALDYLLDYGFDGRPVILRKSSDIHAPYPAGWDTVFTGTIELPEVSIPGYNEGEMVLRLRDRMAELHVKLPLAVYAGTNVLPDGTEGTADDLKNKVKPLLLGKCFNFSLECINTSKLIYAVSPPTGGLADTVANWDGIADFDLIADFFGSVVSGPVITSLGTEYRRGGCSSTGISVYDAAALLLQGADYVDEADLLTNAPAAGYFRVLPAYGYIRLGSDPLGEITCTGQDNNGHDANTVGSIIRCILRDYMQWSVSRFNVSELAALDADCPLEVGQRITQDIYIDDLLDVFAATAGACYYFDQYGVFRIFQIKDPTCCAADVPLTGITKITPKSTGIPNKLIRIKQQRNWTVQKSGLAGIVPGDWRAWIAQEWRESTSLSSACAAKHLLSDELVFESAFAVDATPEADRRRDIYSVRRGLFDIELDPRTWGTELLADWDAAANFDSVTSLDSVDFSIFRIGMVVGLEFNGRLGYTTKNMLITGIDPDLKNDKFILTAWG